MLKVRHAHALKFNIFFLATFCSLALSNERTLAKQFVSFTKLQLNSNFECSSLQLPIFEYFLLNFFIIFPNSSSVSGINLVRSEAKFAAEFKNYWHTTAFKASNSRSYSSLFKKLAI